MSLAVVIQQQVFKSVGATIAQQVVVKRVNSYRTHAGTLVTARTNELCQEEEDENARHLVVSESPISVSSGAVSNQVAQAAFYVKMPTRRYKPWKQ